MNVPPGIDPVTSHSDSDVVQWLNADRQLLSSPQSLGAQRKFRPSKIDVRDTDAFQRRRQKPSSARPTQLSANAEEAITAKEARVAIALTEDITELHFRR
jgi:hypothetical protein